MAKTEVKKVVVVTFPKGAVSEFTAVRWKVWRSNPAKADQFWEYTYGAKFTDYDNSILTDEHR